jgi:hypothetical protein
MRGWLIRKCDDIGIGIRIIRNGEDYDTSRTRREILDTYSKKKKK